MDRAAGPESDLHSPLHSPRPTLAVPPAGSPFGRLQTANLDDAVALSPAMIEALERVHRYARAKTPVVFVGETGTGKSYFAEALHRASGRTGPFVDATAQEIDPELARSQLFGHVRGAFTGADRAHVGLLGQAERGTLLLDDFHLMSRAIQATLLRALERGLYQPLQAERAVPVGCRFVFGMRHDPATLVARGRMLEDLRSRLGFMMVQLPLLRDRRDEIPLLAARFLHAAPEATGVSGGPRAFTPEALTALAAHDYPGNLRDLRGLVCEAYLHAVQAGSSALGAQHLHPSTRAAMRCSRRRSRAENRRAIEWALRVEGGNVSRAAARVSASPHTVRLVKRAANA